jgi:hypothetical protein
LIRNPKFPNFGIKLAIVGVTMQTKQTVGGYLAL